MKIFNKYVKVPLAQECSTKLEKFDDHGILPQA